MTFEDLKRSLGRSRSRGCPICGQENEGNVQIILSEVRDGKNDALVTKSKRMCEEHAVALWSIIDEAFDEFLADAEGGIR
jgi:hypothetical protein